MSDCKGIFQKGQELAGQYNELLRSLDPTPGDGQVVLKDVTDPTINTAMLAHASDQMRTIRQGLKAGQGATMGSCSDRFGFAVSFFGSAGFSSAVSQLEFALAHVRDKNAGVDAFPGLPLIGCSTQDPMQDIADYDGAGTNDHDDLMGDFDLNDDVSDNGSDHDTDIRPDTDTIADKDQVADVDGGIDPDDDEPIDLDHSADEDAVISSDDDATDADQDVDGDVIIAPDDDITLDADQIVDGDSIPPDSDSVSDEDGLVVVDNDVVEDADIVGSDDDIIEIPDVDSNDPPLSCRDGIELLTRGFDGGPADNNSDAPAVSRDGRYVAFQSTASNLVSDDTNGKEDIFVLDRAMQATICISRPIGGGESDGSSYAPSISDDGKLIAFHSDATNLTSPANQPGGIYVYDGNNNIIEKIAISGSGVKISPDGRYVTFSSSAVLVPGDTNGVNDVYIYDRTTHAMRIASISSDTQLGNAESVCPSLTMDANKVAFTASASNFYKRDTNGSPDVFIRENSASATNPLSINYNSSIGDAPSALDCHNNLITPDGHYIVFGSSATNLLGSEISASGAMIYVRDLWTGKAGIELISQGPGGQLPDAPTMQPELSDDGRFAAYASYATNIASNDANPAKDVFVYDRWNNQTQLVTVQPDGSRSWGSSGQPSMSGDSKVLVVKSNGLLTQGAPSSVYNLYAISMGCFFDIDHAKPLVMGPVADQVTWVGRKVEFTVQMSDPAGSHPINYWVESGPTNFVKDTKISRNFYWVPTWDQVGDHIVKICASNLAGDVSCISVVITVKPIELVSRKPDGSLPTRYGYSLGPFSNNPTIDADGSTVAYESQVKELIQDYNPCGAVGNIYKYDRATGTNSCISTGMFGTPPNSGATSPSLSADGRYISFLSSSTNMTPTPESGSFIHDSVDGSISLFYGGNGGSTAISSDGRYISHRIPLSPWADWYDVVRYDRDSETSQLVSTDIPYTAHYNAVSYKPSSVVAGMSGDGRYAAFTVPAVFDIPYSHVFVRDMVDATTEWIDVNDSGQVANGSSSGVGRGGISEDGRYVLFCSSASNLVANDTNGVSDCFVRDRTTQHTKRISITPEGGEFEYATGSPVISKDGTRILFGHTRPTGINNVYRSSYYLYNQETESVVLLDDDMDSTTCYEMNRDGSLAVCVVTPPIDPSHPIPVVAILGIDYYLNK